jgi:hypothetical protein
MGSMFSLISVVIFFYLIHFAFTKKSNDDPFFLINLKPKLLEERIYLFLHAYNRILNI